MQTQKSIAGEVSKGKARVTGDHCRGGLLCEAKFLVDALSEGSSLSVVIACTELRSNGAIFVFTKNMFTFFSRLCPMDAVVGWDVFDAKKNWRSRQRKVCGGKQMSCNMKEKKEVKDQLKRKEILEVLNRKIAKQLSPLETVNGWLRDSWWLSWQAQASHEWVRSHPATAQHALHTLVPLWVHGDDVHYSRLGKCCVVSYGSRMAAADESPYASRFTFTCLPYDWICMSWSMFTKTVWHVCMVCMRISMWLIVSIWEADVLESHVVLD